MGYRLFRFEEIATKNIAVGSIVIAFIHPPKTVFFALVKDGQIIPTHIRMHMVHRMEIIV